MTAKELNKSYQEKKERFHDYINNIKKKSKWDLYTIVNPTLVKNPYASDFPKNYFFNIVKKENKIIQFIKVALKYYVKNLYLFITYFSAFILYKIYYKKTRQAEITDIIDVFGLVDKTNQNGRFSENYLADVYEIFEKHDTKYTILLRLYGVGKNPFKLKQFFQIIKNDKRDFIFEYELLGSFDFVRLFGLFLIYPFKTLNLLKKESDEIDNIFNFSFINDIKYFSFDSLTRYILGKNLAKINSIEKIYSWSEFQVIERSFNYGIRKNNYKIRIIACQFYLNYESYFNAYVDDLDYDMLASPHEVLVNGKYYILDREKVTYSTGVSLRYKNIFDFKGITEEKNILLLGSYIERDTKYMLECVKDFDNVIFKNHPVVDIGRLGKLPKNIIVSNENIYELFKNSKFVIGTASGTVVEAIGCGLSVIIIASQENLTANPLIDYGKGEMWDIVFSKDDIYTLYNKLLKYKKNNAEKIKSISLWYKENFFIEPTEENIVKVFNL